MKQQSMKSYKHVIIIISVLVLLIVLFVTQPLNIFGDQPTTGEVSLIRDDFELDVYFQRIGYYYDNGIPFQSDRVEYPVLGLFYLTIPALFTDTQADYDIALIVQNILFLVILIILTYELIKILGRDKRQIWLFILPAGVENALFPYMFQSTRNFAYGSIYAIFISSNWDYFSEAFWSWYMFIGSKILAVLQLALPFIIYVSYKKFRHHIKTPTNLVMWSLLVLSFYIFLSPYYSPQWFLWLLPLLVLLPLNKKEVWLIIVYDLLNFIFFPVVYRYIGYESYIIDIVVFMRSAVFIWLIFMLVKKINRD